MARAGAVQIRDANGVRPIINACWTPKSGDFGPWRACLHPRATFTNH